MKEILSFKELVHISLIVLFFASPCVLFTQVIYVNANVAGGNGDGTSWENAFPDIQDALATAQYGDEIWVAKGGYRPTAFNRSVSFEIGNGVSLYGGFLGTETSLDQRDWVGNETILSGDIGILGDSTDNSYNVVYMEDVDSTTVLDGFVVEKGNATTAGGGSFTGRTKAGGGLYLLSTIDSLDAEPKIANCVFRKNTSQNFGGGMFLNDSSNGSSSPIIFNCKFLNNISSNGGGIAKYGASRNNIFTVVNCQLDHNEAKGFGGGIYYNMTHGNRDILIKDCSFYMNRSVAEGGGIFLEKSNDQGIMLIEKCLFDANASNLSGSAINIFNFGPGNLSGISIDYSEFLNHERTAIAAHQLYDNKQSVFMVRNSTFSLNKGQVLFFEKNNAEITNCLFTNNFYYTSLIEFNGGTSSHFTSCLVTNNAYLPNHIENEGIISYSGIDPDITVEFNNCIIWHNQKTEDGTIISIPESVFSYSLIEATICNEISSGTITCGPGNLFNLDPLFLDTAAGDFRLHPCSPARNAGDNAILNQLGITTDIDGNPRIREGTVDMGAFEMPAFDVLLSGTSDADCHGESSGTATLDVQSGCGPFTIEFGGASTFTDTLPYVLDGLSPGTLNITVTDSDDRTEEILVNIGEPPLLTATTSTTPVDCTEGTFGMATASIGGGTPGYTIRWSDSTAMATASLPAGPHALQVTDSLGCVAVDSFTIEAVGMLAVAADSTAISCHPANGDSANGSATATPDGLAPYNWQWQDGQSTETIGQLPPGTYTATVTDALGCTGTATISLTAPDSIALSIEAPGLVCQGSMDAMAAALASGGTLPYFFQWENGATDSLLTNLGPGQYALTLTDGNGCISQSGIQILENTSVQLDTTIQHATGAINTDGAIFTSNPQGGQPPYLFLWETGDTTGFIENVPPGSYALTVTDSLGCETVFTFMVDFEVAASEALEGISLTLWPVPVAAGGTCHLRVESQKSERLKWYLLDAPGRTLQSGVVDVVAGETLHRFPAPAVAGHYWLVLEDSKGKGAVLELVVQ